MNRFRKRTMKELERPDLQDYSKMQKRPVIVVLDNIRSLHNIGSVFRTADAFCIQAIWLCGITARPPHREIHKTALGSTDAVPWQYFETPRNVIDALQKSGHELIVIEQAIGSISPEHFEPNDKPIAVVFGNEVEGVSETFLEAAEQVIEIPQYGTKHSLNISVSAGIVLWELAKKIKA